MERDGQSEEWKAKDGAITRKISDIELPLEEMERGLDGNLKELKSLKVGAWMIEKISSPKN